jgi:hypothetical protein
MIFIPPTLGAYVILIAALDTWCAIEILTWALNLRLLLLALTATFDLNVSHIVCHAICLSV